MSSSSTIELTDASWNPVRGCTKISPGYKNCYAKTFAERWRGIPGHAYEQGFDLHLVPEHLGGSEGQTHPLGRQLGGSQAWGSAHRYASELGGAHTFLSAEPLLEDLGTIDLSGISWLIASGESGPGARPMDESWVRSIRRQCRIYDVPFFFKQWGGVDKKLADRLLDGRNYDEFPKIQSGLVPTPKFRRELLESFSHA